ncbi:MAG TPA: hypothetical protein VLE53_20140 [Gemmatimonadaceae bacterium]|nr:hypothetical protein [Gemmatimonadaceae bacterium]
MNPSVPELLQDATQRGIISAEQAESILRLAGEAPMFTPAREAPRGFNWVTAAYALGALLVIFAAAWFLVERWRALGPAGVLAVSGIYAVALAAVARGLARSGFREAAGITAMLAVALVPVAVWALQSLSGWWPEQPWGEPVYPIYPPAEAQRALVASLATILAGLLVLRRASWVAMSLPLSGALLAVGLSLPRALTEELAPLLERWTLLTTALALCATADMIDRAQGWPQQRQGGGRGDFAFTFWLLGLVAGAAAMLAFWPTMGGLRHALPLLSLLLVFAALFLRRRTHLVFGIVVAFLYLLYLAGEVFEEAAVFPIVLAVLGGGVILTTVWLQRRFPALVARVNALRAIDRPGLPGARWIPWAFVGLSLGITLLALPEAREERVQRAFEQRLYLLRLHSRSLSAPPVRPIPGAPPRTPVPRPAADSRPARPPR